MHIMECVHVCMWYVFLYHALIVELACKWVPHLAVWNTVNLSTVKICGPELQDIQTVNRSVLLPELWTRDEVCKAKQLPFRYLFIEASQSMASKDGRRETLLSLYCCQARRPWSKFPVWCQLLLCFTGQHLKSEDPGFCIASLTHTNRSEPLTMSAGCRGKNGGDVRRNHQWSIISSAGQASPTPACGRSKKSS